MHAEAQMLTLTPPGNTPDTIIFPFRNGLQMIMIDYESARERLVSFKEMTAPRAMPWSAIIPPASPNLILFRDSSLKITKVFNSNVNAGYWEKLFSRKRQNISPNVHSHIYPYGHPTDLSRSFHLPGRYSLDRLPNGYYLVYKTPIPARIKISGKTGKTGLIDSMGNFVLQMEYEAILPKGKNYLIKQNGSWGLMNPSFTWIIDCRYNEVQTGLNEYLIFYTTNTPRIVYDNEKNRISKLENIDWIDEQQITSGDASRRSMPIRVSDHGKFGLINRQFKQIASCTYDFIYPVYRDGLLLVNKKNKWGYLNENGEEIIPCMFDDAVAFDKSVAVVSLNGYIYCINKKGEEIPDCLYAGSRPEQILQWKESHAGPGRTRVVSRMHMQGLIDEHNKLIVPIIYRSIRALDNSPNESPGMNRKKYLLARRSDKWGIITTNHEEILPFVYDDIRQFTGAGKFIPVTQNQKHGLLDSNLNWVASCTYEALNPHSVPGKLLFMKNGKWGWMNMQEQEELPPIYDHIGWIKNGKVVVSINKKSGMLNRDGLLLIPIKYDFLAEEYKNGLLLAGLEKRIGYLDSSGRVAIPFQFEEGRNFEKAVAGVKQGGRFGFINLQGKQVGGFDYDFIDHQWMPDGLIKVRRQNKYGFADDSGQLVIPCIYDDVSGYNRQGHRVLLGSQWTYVTKP